MPQYRHYEKVGNKVFHDFHDFYLTVWEEEKDFPYIVTADNCPHKGFKTKFELIHWINQMGLTFTQDILEGQSQKLLGYYTEVAWLDSRAFHEKWISGNGWNFSIPYMDNGNYTLGLVRTTTKIHEIHYVNCNYPRIILSRTQVLEMENGVF